MNKNKHQYQQGFAITTIVAIVSFVSLMVSGTKVATHVYEKNETEKIAEQFEEQAQHLADRAKDMGAGGDEAVRESLRLHEAAKDIKEHGTLVYQQKMVGEAASMTKSLVTSKVVGDVVGDVAEGLGATEKAAEELVDVSGALLDLDGIESDLQTAEDIATGKTKTDTKEGRKLAKLIQDSRHNVDDFNKAQVKAMTDELINMREDLEKMGDEIEDWIAIREQALKDLEEAAYLRRLNQREKSRLAVLENDDLSQMVQQDFAGEETPIDVVKAMSGKSVEEWEKEQQAYEKKVAETKAGGEKKEVEGKLPNKEFSSEKVVQALKKAKEEMGWAEYESHEFGNWHISRTRDKWYEEYIFVYYIPESEKNVDGSVFGGFFSPDDWTKEVDEHGNRSKDIVPGAKAFCNSSGSGSELIVYLQNNWVVKTYKTGSYECGAAFEHLKTFWKYL